jgi:hypothetical protein
MKHLTIAIRRVLSYFEIVTLQPKLPILHKEKTPARMTLPTILITDPKFVYQSAACTDISQTFQKAKDERLQRLRNDANGNRKQDQGTVPQMSKQKLRRVHG